jgi:uncharacterized protein
VLESSTLSATPPSTAPAPVAPEERSITLDILRGVCLLGILLTNITNFVSLEFFAPNFYLTEAGFRVDDLTNMFVTSSFRPSLSVLFGLGFALQLRRNPKAVGRFSRRLFVLLAFGLIHGYLIWNGDILTEYALVGFLLIPFARRNNVIVVACSLLVYLLMPITIAIHNALNLNLNYEAIANTFMNGSFAEIFRTNALVYTERLIISIMYVSQTISCFLLGLWLGRVGALENPKAHRGFLMGSLIVMSLCAWWGYNNVRDNFFLDNLFASPTLGFAYISLLALLVSFPFFKNIFYFFSYIGRMALTTYITDSVVLSILFYNFGFGLYGQLHSGEWVWIALALFSVQIFFSALWLRAFRYGPLEWLWRSLTYGKFQPIRKGSSRAYSSFGLEKTTEPLLTPTIENEILLETPPNHEEDKLEKPIETLETSEVTDWQKELEELSEPSSDKSQALEETNQDLKNEKIVPK